MGDIYPGGEIPLPLDLNAASFAKLESREPADLAHALMGMLGENIALICGTLARSHGAQAVVCCGSTLIQNPELREILRWVTQAYGAQPHFLDSGAYCGAFGAAALADEGEAEEARPIPALASAESQHHLVGDRIRLLVFLLGGHRGSGAEEHQEHESASHGRHYSDVEDSVLPLPEPPKA